MQEPCDMEHGSQNHETPEIQAALPDILEEDPSSDVCIVIILYGCLNLYIILFTAFILMHLRKRVHLTHIILEVLDTGSSWS
jgi:hypothetical protein